MIAALRRWLAYAILIPCGVMAVFAIRLWGTPHVLAFIRKPEAEPAPTPGQTPATALQDRPAIFH